MARSTLAGIILLAALPVGTAGQPVPVRGQVVAESLTIIPGLRYRAGSLKALMAGRGYRDLWTTPLSVEVADLSRLGGGLTPLRVGGGATTKTLHLRGADGKRYVLRSVDKFVGQGIAEELRGTLYESALQDQISAFHPSAALVTAALLEAAGVLHAEPRLVVVPDDPRLGEYREEFAGMLALFEERPDEGQEEAAGFAGSARIVGSERLFELVEEDPRHRVDARAFLKARLIDLLVGDRDRNKDNWRWARFDDADRYLWRPIPRDRDQALIRLDGFLKSILRLYDPRLVAFDDEYPSIVALTRNAWDLDRRFLVSLEKPAWDSVVAGLQERLSNPVIDAAVRHLPSEHYRLMGESLAEALKKRRDRLPAAADRFYEIVARYADIHASDEPELAVVDRLDDERVEVRLYRRPDDDTEPRQPPYFRRTFERRETREIRLYLHGGADRAVVRGSVSTSIRVRVIGGGGADDLIDSSRVRARDTYFYDGGSETYFVRGPKTAVVRRRAPTPVAWQDFVGPIEPDWGSAWRPAPGLGYDRDRGLFVAAGATHYRYGFLKAPYSSRFRITGGFATGVGGLVLDYAHDFRDLARHLHPSLHARLSGIETIFFHGFGNETEALEPRSFYRVNQREVLLAPSVTVSAGSTVQLDLGLALKALSTDTTIAANTFLAESRPYGSGSFSQFGARAALRVDTRNRPIAPTQGIFLIGAGSFFPALLDVDRGAFGDMHGEAMMYLSPPGSANPTLALRVGAKKVWGTFPFHEAAFVGGVETIRAFREDRFAGSASAYGNAELRVFVTKLSLLLPTDFGLFGFTDWGRVFVKGEESGKWHAAVGGGIWFAPVRPSNTFSIALATSEERTSLYIGTGFHF